MIIGGVILQLARQPWIIPIYILLTIAAICLTPWEVQLVRYLTPLCPFLALALFTSLLYFKELLSKVLPRASKSVGVFFTVSVVSLILIEQSIVYYQAHTGWIDEIVYNARDGKRLNI